jgi:ABC-type phosphate/phosphonate transport system substrate-binding protein
VEKDAKPVYVGTIGSAAMNVYSGLTVAGCIWPPAWEELKKEQPEVVNALAIGWRSDALKTGAFVARSSMPKAHLDAIAKAMFDLNKTEQGRSILARLYFPEVVPATSKTYDPVRKFLQEYKRLFGKLPEMEGPDK